MAMRIEDVQADGYDVFDVVTGNYVLSFDGSVELKKGLPDVLLSVMDRRDELMVFALDGEGEVLESWLASDLLVAS